MSGLKGSYEEKLDQVGLTTLIDRRARGDLIQTYKIMNQVDDIPVNTFFKIAGEGHDHATRSAVIIEGNVAGTNMNLAMPRANLEVRRNSFSHRVVTPWSVVVKHYNFYIDNYYFTNNWSF